MGLVLDELKQILGSQYAIADKFGVSQVAVCKWFKRGYLPPIRAVQAQELTGIDAIKFIVEAMESEK